MSVVPAGKQKGVFAIERPSRINNIPL